MFSGNPAYGMVPETPPGWEALRYLAGNIVGPMTGSAVRPYVPPTQSLFDAQMARYVNDPLYRQMMTSVYGQLGTQIGNTVGGFRWVQDFAVRSGYSPQQIQADLRGLGAGFGRSALGSMFMPLLDEGMSAIGLTNGSYTQAASALFASRMMLSSPMGTVNPYNVAQQHGSMASASAMMSLINGITSRKDAAGNLLLSPDYGVTQGFGLGQISQLAMRMAGAGAFTTNAGGFGARLQAAAGGIDIGDLDFTLGDFTGGTGRGNVAGGSAERIRRFKDQFESTMKSGLEAMGAMRDMLKTVDGIEDKLTQLTNGGWLRSGAGAAAAASGVRRLHAMSQMYDLDPTAVMDRLGRNRGLLQEAAGFGANMQFFGFDGGGMFGLGAQTALMSSIEDMVTARGVRGDPVLAERLRRQGVQAFARNMNTQAGVAAQALAYGRQLGIFSDAEADSLRAGLTSGDRGVMEDTLNRMLVTEFGSAKRGRELLRDQMFVNGMRQNMDDRAGRFATEMTIAGADSEWARRERLTAIDERLKFAKGLLQGAGIGASPTEAGVGLTVERISDALNKASGSDKYGDTFRAQYGAYIQAGMKPATAMAAAISAMKSNSVTAKYSETIDAAFKEQSAINAETSFLDSGLESMQARAMASALVRGRDITGKQYSEILKKIRNGDAAGALADVERVNSALSPERQRLNNAIREDATARFNAGKEAIADKRAVAGLIATAGANKFGSSAVVGAFTDIIGAVNTYLGGGKGTADLDALYDALDRSEAGRIFGADFEKEMHAALRGSGATDETRRAFATRLGRQVIHLRQQAGTMLRDFGYDLSYDGYFGGGRYGGNDARIAAQREKEIQDVVNGMRENNRYSAKDRNTFAQDLVDMMSGGNWRDLLRLRDPNGALSEIDKKYGFFDQYTKYEAALKTFQERESGLTDAIHLLNRTDRADAAKELRKMAANIGKKGEHGEELVTDADIDKFISAQGLTGDQAKNLRWALQAKRDATGAGALADLLRKRFVGDSGFQDAANVVHVNADYDRAMAARAARDYEDVLPFVERLDFDKLGKGMAEAYAAAEKAISDDETAAELGVSKEALANAKKGAVGAARLKRLFAKAASGDEAALAAAEKVRAVAAQGTTKISGRITLQINGESVPAMLEGNLGDRL